MFGVPFLERALTGLLRPHSLDDPVDRLNYFVTTMLLTFFAIMVSAKQYVGSPIQCWAPIEFKGGWEQYTEDYCFIQNTFYVPFEEEIPADTEDREKAQIGYYQWVPIVLALQAIMFYVPNWIWKTLNKQTGIDIECAVTDAQNMSALPAVDRKVEAEKLAEYLYEALHMSCGEKKPKHTRLFCFSFGNNHGSYVSCLYIGTKVAYLVNLVLQIFLLNKFLGFDDVFWGFDMIGGLMRGEEWHESGVFPRVTLCDFGVRKLANLHRYTVQCVLMINMFNEKIYLFLWFWFMTVLIVSLINFIYCVLHTVLTHARVSSCRNWLSALKNPNEIHQITHRDDVMVSRFAISGLRHDGILVMRFIEGHAGAMVTKELAIELFKKFIDFYRMTLVNPASTQPMSSGFEVPHETLYNPEKAGFLEDPDKVDIMQPDYKL